MLWNKIITVLYTVYVCILYVDTSTEPPVEDVPETNSNPG